MSKTKKDKLGPVMKDLRNILFPVMVHELGHWVVAKKTGFDTGNLKIKVGYSTSGPWATGSATVFLQQPLNDIESVKDYLEKRIAVLCGGALAESLITIPENIEQVDHFKKVLSSNGESDYQKAEELMNMLRNIIRADELILKNGPMERWKILGKSVEKFDFTEVEKAFIKSTADEFTESIIEKIKKGAGFEYEISKEKLDNIYILNSFIEKKRNFIIK